jgi:hypothetical protein
VRGWLVLLVMGCVETGLGGGPGGATPGGEPGEDGETDGRTGGEDETCNGRDDDLDGRVDEGFPDVDGDGVADCVDEDCQVPRHPPGQVARAAICTGDGAGLWGDPFALQVEWRWRGAPVVASPVVALLDDDDQDGDVDTEDSPDVVLPLFGEEALLALSGDGERRLWRLEGFRGDAGPAAADLDGDGVTEVVAVTSDDRVAALRADGTHWWTSEERFRLLYPTVAVGSAGPAGGLRLVVDRVILDGRTGERVGELPVPRHRPWRAPLVTDLDLDGLDEVLLGGGVFTLEGTLQWRTPDRPDAIAAFGVPVQADDDPPAEVLWAMGDQVRLHDTDGRSLWTVSLELGERPGPPCVGDLDGDGWSEVVVPGRGGLNALDRTGRLRWSAPVQDTSGAAGCAVWDLDADGRLEVLYADMQDFHVLDGATGATRYRDPSHDSITYFETPVVADVDGDGSGEVLVAGSGAGPVRGLAVYGQREDGWPAAGPTWAAHDFDGSNVGPDGRVPGHPQPGWSRHGVVRGRPADDARARPDLALHVDGICLASCAPGGLLRIGLRVANEGRVPVGPGVVVVLRDPEGHEVRRLVLDALPAGRIGATHTVDLPWTRVPQGFELVVDPDDRIAECDEGDNRFLWREPLCGG